MTTTAQRLVSRVREARGVTAPRVTGRVARVVGLNLELEGLDAGIGDGIVVETANGPVPGEVIAIHDGRLTCMPLGELTGIRAGTPVTAAGGRLTVPVGARLLGRVLDGLGRPLDQGPSLADLERVSIDGSVPHPLERTVIDRQLPLGVRAIDTLVPCGRGQRLGIFAGSGVGKSTLLSMIVRGTEAPVSVLALIGERGREVRQFLDYDLGPEGLARSVVVVATSDEPALVRLRAAFTATRIAEWFRDRGVDVLLMMDSLTRFAMAQREVGLSAGEPPATRGYPPSVFALLPRLLERAGTDAQGSITGLYTVLVEGDDMNEPIADAARSILDGHIVLSRRLASAGHYPCIDILDSVSRVSTQVTSRPQAEAATELRRLLAAERDARDLVDIGAYVPGSNPTVDRALALSSGISSYLRQPSDEIVPVTASWARLLSLIGSPS